MWEKLQVVLTIVTLALAVSAILTAIFSRRWTGAQKAGWVLLIVFLPLIGAVCFFIADRIKAGRRTSRA